MGGFLLRNSPPPRSPRQPDAGRAPSAKSYLPSSSRIFLFKWTNGRMSPIPSNANARAALSHGAVRRRTSSSGSKSRQTIHRCCNIKILNSGTTQRPTSPNVDEPPLVKIIHRADADGSTPNPRSPPGQPLRASMTAGNRTVARAKRCGRGDTGFHHTR